MPLTLHNTFAIERNYAVAPPRVFAAFADATKKQRWFAQGTHHDVEEFKLDFQEGGREYVRSRFREGTAFPGVVLINEGYIQEIQLNHRIVSASTMTIGDRRISASLVTVELVPTEGGTTLTITHQGAFFEGADGPKIREAGWRELCDRLAIELSS